jgi:hypothetical protein
MPFITKNRPTPDQMYVRLSMFAQRFPWAFRQPRTARPDATDPKPLLLEGYGHRIGMTGMLPKRQRSQRGERKAALQAVCDETVRFEREYRDLKRENAAKGKPTTTPQDEYVRARLGSSPKYRAAMATLHPEQADA